MARTFSTFVTICSALRAAKPPMDTWSSFAPLVDRESHDAGCTRTLFSDTRDAAVQCAIMNPEQRPPSATRKAGSSLSCGLLLK
jgi:hypothetical protein